MHIPGKCVRYKKGGCRSSLLDHVIILGRTIAYVYKRPRIKPPGNPEKPPSNRLNLQDLAARNVVPCSGSAPLGLLPGLEATRGQGQGGGDSGAALRPVLLQEVPEGLFYQIVERSVLADGENLGLINEAADDPHAELLLLSGC